MGLLRVDKFICCGYSTTKFATCRPMEVVQHYGTSLPGCLEAWMHSARSLFGAATRWGTDQPVT